MLCTYILRLLRVSFAEMPYIYKSTLRIKTVQKFFIFFDKIFSQSCPLGIRPLILYAISYHFFHQLSIDTTHSILSLDRTFLINVANLVILNRSAQNIAFFWFCYQVILWNSDTHGTPR